MPSPDKRRAKKAAQKTASSSGKGVLGRAQKKAVATAKKSGPGGLLGWHKRKQDSALSRDMADAAMAWSAAALDAGPSAGPSDFELMLSSLASDGGISEMYLPAPNRADYLAPYEQARTRANESYNRTVPELQALYGGLQQELQAGNADFMAQANALQAERQGQMDARLAEVTAPEVKQASLVAGGEVAEANDAARAGNVARLQESYDAERARQSRLSQVDSQAATARQGDARTAEANSSANARNNLDDILAQIGLGEAGAIREFNADAQDVALKNAQLKNQYAEQQREINRERLSNILTLQKGIAERATSTGRERFERKINEQGIGSTKYPKAFAVFQDIVGAAGKGAAGKQRALRILQAGDAGAGKYELKDGSVINSRLDEEILAQWIEDWYDEEPSLDEEMFIELGGNPDALSYLTAADDPELALLLMQLGA